MRTLYLFILLVAVGCEKDEKICWICDINVPSSVPPPGKVEICNDSEHPPQEYSDGQGNTWGGFQCTKK